MAIKVSDVRAAHPQIGVDRADIVVVEPIGVSYTRLLAVFHSDLPDRVGPVRSVRPVDAPLLGPMNPVFGNTMGAPWVVAYVDSVAHLDDLGTLRVTGSGAYTIDAARTAPNHVFARPAVLLGLSELTASPAPYVRYAAGPAGASAPHAGGPGSTVGVSYGPGWTVHWTFDETARTYLRSEPWGPHRMADGARVSATNVLVLRVASRVGKIGSGSGAPVPILEMVHGSGTFTAFAGGSSVTGTWSKAEVNDPFTFRTDDGNDLRLAPGRTWIELPDPAAQVTVG